MPNAQNRRRPQPATPPTQPDERTLERFHAQLAIDREDLDECWVRQPELYFNVSDAHVLAVAERDAIKLELEEAQAEEGKRLREDAAQHNEKITEASINQNVLLAPKVKQLQRELIAAQTLVGRWQALSRSYEQRRDALKGITSSFIARLGGGSAYGSRNDMADAIHQRAVEERTRRRRLRDSH